MAKHVPASACVEDQETRMLRDSIRGFMARELTEERISQCEATGDLPWAIMGELRQFGYLGGLLSEEAGGYGLSYRTWAMMMEEAGYRWLSLRVLLNTVNIVIALFHHLGDARQKEKWLKPVMAGQMPVWVGITEPDHGSDVASVQTRAEDKGDHWLINGGKLWTTNGVNGRVGILVARTFTEGCDGDLSLFIVDLEETDFEASRVGTMFIKATATSQLAFQDAKVPKENLLGPAGKGLKAILTGLNYGRLNVAAGAVGAGLFLGAAMVLLLEFLHPKIRQPSELTKKLGITPLGTLPFVEPPRKSWGWGRRRYGVAALAMIVLALVTGLLAVDQQLLPLEQLAEKIMAHARL